MFEVLQKFQVLQMCQCMRSDRQFLCQVFSLTCIICDAFDETMRLERFFWDVTSLKHRKSSMYTDNIHICGYVFIYIYIYIDRPGMKSTRPGVTMIICMCVDPGREALCFSRQAEIPGLGAGNIPFALGAGWASFHGRA